MRRPQTVSLAFKRLPIPEKIVFGDNVVAQLTTHADTFPAPPIRLADLTKANNDLRAASAAALTGDREATALMHERARAWDTAFATTAEYVDDIARGLESTILLAGYEATRGETTPAQIPGPAQNVEVFGNRRAGSLHVACQSAGPDAMYGFVVVKAGAVVRIEGNIVSVEGAADGPVHFVVSSRREMDIDGLRSGTQVAVYVYISNTAGSGPLSGAQLVYVP